jgi:hypothetical protein
MERECTHPGGVIRREFLQVGFSGFVGLGLAELLARSPRGTITLAMPRASITSVPAKTACPAE